MGPFNSREIDWRSTISIINTHEDTDRSVWSQIRKVRGEANIKIFNKWELIIFASHKKVTWIFHLDNIPVNALSVCLLLFVDRCLFHYCMLLCKCNFKQLHNEVRTVHITGIHAGKPAHFYFFLWCAWHLWEECLQTLIQEYHVDTGAHSTRWGWISERRLTTGVPWAFVKYASRLWVEWVIIKLNLQIVNMIIIPRCYS